MIGSPFAMQPLRMGLPGSPTVLVVDDEPQICSFVTAVLRKEGYCAFSAASGEVGFALFVEHLRETDVVLTDVAMPRMTGPQMVHRMLSVKPDLCVIFMSGYSPEAIMPEEYAQRFSLLHKPFTMEGLVAAVRNAFTTGTCRSAGADHDLRA